MLCGTGHNLRLIPAALRLNCTQFGLAALTIIAALVFPPVVGRRVCPLKVGLFGVDYLVKTERIIG